LKLRKAKGIDEVPAELWRAVIEEDGAGARWINGFLNELWEGKQIPEEWRIARVAAVFKKGDLGDCGNYRPISLLCVGYKLYAQILLQRLKDAGAEDRICSTQFGFKANTGTDDALLLARLMIQQAVGRKDGKLLMVALDWAKAFDSIAPERLLKAMLRFGVPAPFVAAVSAIYDQRSFFVREAGRDSEYHPQCYGIVQGCPLSPFLFVIAMTCLMHDAEQKVVAKHGGISEPGLVTRSLLYADDTLIVDADREVAQTFVDAIRDAGEEYGLKFNEAKLEVLAVNHDGEILKEDGRPIKKKDSMNYLGGLLAADGRIASELARRIGSAEQSFKKLVRVWKRASIAKARKVEIYESCVVSRLLYGLGAAWLNKAERARLDAFHCRCLRRIMGISHSYYSRVSNADVLEAAGSNPLQQKLLQRQLTLYGRIAVKPPGHPLRRAVLIDGDVQPAPFEGSRRRGRPLQDWRRMVYAEALQAAGGLESLRQIVHDRRAWKHVISQHLLNR
jgi:hypothetical protein